MGCDASMSGQGSQASASTSVLLSSCPAVPPSWALAQHFLLLALPLHMTLGVSEDRWFLESPCPVSPAGWNPEHNIGLPALPSTGYLYPKHHLRHGSGRHHEGRSLLQDASNLCLFSLSPSQGPGHGSSDSPPHLCPLSLPLSLPLWSRKYRSSKGP